MNRRFTLLTIIIFFAFTVSAQTLFTYGKHAVDSKDFLKAYNKNNNTKPADKAKAIRNYLDLYIASRLKIQEAYNRGYDTLPQIAVEIQNLRSQIIKNYLNDPTVTDNLVKEAFARSQKDIHAAHIFISYMNKIGYADTVAAQLKATEVMEKIKKGADFASLAKEYSSDPAAAQNGGDLGYITVFTLPYQLENLLYTTAPGKVSPIYKSKIGFHIFKNLGERKAIGKIKAAQILLAYPPSATEADKKKLMSLADSLYQRLLKGDDFGTLASKFSNDYITANSNGLIPPFTVGQYDPVFENTVLALKDGALAKPFMTSHGIHIVKRIGLIPANADAKDKVAMDDLRSRVVQSDRMQLAKAKLAEQILAKTPVVKTNYSEKELWILSDSMLNYTAKVMPVSITPYDTLLFLGKKAVKVEDWISYARVWRYKSDGSGLKPYAQLWDEFMRNQAENYYRDHLEDFNDDFRFQMNEFKDGNLFFEIMQQEIWGKAQTDTIALKEYYDAHQSNYKWKESADAVIFFCADEATAKTFYEQIKKDPKAFRKTTDAFGEKINADSSRVEFSQIPNKNKMLPQAGMLTTPVVNKTDGSVSFAYVIKTYPANMQRNFYEAKGIVINDYQAELEKQWIEALKKKYPVKINEEELKRISK